MTKGYIHIYTGNGKGKTTTALGVACRSIANGYNVSIGQFIKSKGFRYSEAVTIEALNSIGGELGKINLEQFGKGCCIDGTPTLTDKELAQDGWKKAKEWIASGKWDVVILDELNVALHLGLLDINDVLSVLRKKPEHVEILITGRHAPQELIEIADLVSEIKEIKHYYNKGVLSRDGIDK